MLAESWGEGVVGRARAETQPVLVMVAEEKGVEQLNVVPS